MGAGGVRERRRPAPSNQTGYGCTMLNVSVFPERNEVHNVSFGLTKDSAVYRLIQEAVSVEVLKVQMGLKSGCEFHLSQTLGQGSLDLSFGIAEIEDVSSDYSSRTLVGYCFFIGQHTYFTWESDGDRGHDYVSLCDSTLVWALKSELARISESAFGAGTRVFSSCSLLFADNCGYEHVGAEFTDGGYRIFGDDQVFSICDVHFSLCGVGQ